MLALQSTQTSLPLDYATFGLLCLVAGCLALRLPETRGRALPETVADLDAVAADREAGRQLVSDDKVRLLQEEIEANSFSDEDEAEQLY